MLGAQNDEHSVDSLIGAIVKLLDSKCFRHFGNIDILTDGITHIQSQWSMHASQSNFGIRKLSLRICSPYIRVKNRRILATCSLTCLHNTHTHTLLNVVLLLWVVPVFFCCKMPAATTKMLLNIVRVHILSSPVETLRMLAWIGNEPSVHWVSKYTKLPFTSCKYLMWHDLCYKVLKLTVSCASTCWYSRTNINATDSISQVPFCTLKIAAEMILLIFI